MANENALFEDDFDTEFEEEFDPAEGRAPPPVTDDPETEIDAAPFAATGGFAEADFDGGSRRIPAISVQAFCEREDTGALMGGVARDRRMSSAAMDIREGGLAGAIEYLSSNATPNLLIIESTLPTAEMVRKIDELAAHCDENVQVMVIGAMNDIALYRQLVARGVSEYLVPPIQPVQVIRTISDLFTDPDAPFVGKSIAVVGAKGGVGASTLAHNLAWSITENARLNAALIDLDLSFGTTALDFNQESSQTVADALMAPERADAVLIQRLLTKVTDRLSIFTAPATIGQVMDYPAEAFDTVIEGVRGMVPYLVLDLPHAWSQWVHNTLVAADEVILVCQPDLASLRNGKNIIDQLKAERPNDGEPRLALNMAGVPKRPEIPVKDFASAIGVEPEIILPFEPQLFGTAANNGQMISEADPQAKSSLAIDHLAGVITGQSISAPKRSLVQKLLGK